MRTYVYGRYTPDVMRIKERKTPEGRNEGLKGPSCLCFPSLQQVPFDLSPLPLGAFA